MSQWKIFDPDRPPTPNSPQPVDQGTYGPGWPVASISGSTLSAGLYPAIGASHYQCPVALTFRSTRGSFLVEHSPPRPPATRNELNSKSRWRTPSILICQ